MRRFRCLLGRVRERDCRTQFLRGYQVTGADGAVEFTTIYPGWYRGRAIHIHFKVRKFDGSTKTYEFTSQIFFDEATNNAVMAQSPYNSRGLPDSRNASDNIYGSDGSQLTATLTREGNGYLGTFNIGLGELPAGNSGGAADTSVAATLGTTRWRRAPAGGRILALTLDLDESLAADIRLFVARASSPPAVHERAGRDENALTRHPPYGVTPFLLTPQLETATAA